MSITWSQSDATLTDGDSQDVDDAEKGIYDNSQSLSVLSSSAKGDQKTQVYVDSCVSPSSSIVEDITPASSVSVLSLSTPPGEKTTNAKKLPKRSRWILFQLWFNTYRKFFIFVTLLNLTGIIMAALGRFRYAENHLGALVLGNLLCAILFRNELFLRFLYIIAIYGLRSVCPFLHH
jgi:hypothetical protein